MSQQSICFALGRGFAGSEHSKTESKVMVDLVAFLRKEPNLSIDQVAVKLLKEPELAGMDKSNFFTEAVSKHMFEKMGNKTQRIAMKAEQNRRSEEDQRARELQVRQ